MSQARVTAVRVMVGLHVELGTAGGEKQLEEEWEGEVQRVGEQVMVMGVSGLTWSEGQRVPSGEVTLDLSFEG